jgi:DNA helicase HerA-like ATPase
MLDDGNKTTNDSGTDPADSAARADPARIGRVISVSGSQVIGLLELDRIEGSAAWSRPPEIGSAVSIATPGSLIIALVTGASIPIPDAVEQKAELKILELEMVGEIEETGNSRRRFQRGASNHPALGDTIAFISRDDLVLVFADPSDSAVRVGVIHQDRSIPAFVKVNDLLGKHFAILGTTGTGKSCTAATILRAILANHASGHIVILDPHNEYAPAFGDQAEVITPSTLELPYWLLNFDEIKELITGGKPGTENDATILNQVIVHAKRALFGTNEPDFVITVDSPIPYRLSDVNKFIEDALGKLDRPTDTAPYLRIRERFSQLQNDKRFSFMFPGALSARDTMAKILARLFRIPVAGKPVTIVDLSGVPSEVINVVVSLLCRMTFDFAMWSERAVPVLLVCEEAHRYAPDDSAAGFEPTKRAIAKIAKEGRKYGVSLCMVTQRPAELAMSVLSQCSTIFALRLGNQNDQDFVRAALPESSVGLMDSLSSLRNAEAIVVGEGVPMATRIVFDDLPQNYRPHSQTAPFSTAWSSDISDPNFLAEIVTRWRRQR